MKKQDVMSQEKGQNAQAYLVILELHCPLQFDTGIRTENISVIMTEGDHLLF